MTVKPPNAMCYIPGMLRQTPNINVHIKPLVSKVIEHLEAITQDIVHAVMNW